MDGFLDERTGDDVPSVLAEREQTAADFFGSALVDRQADQLAVRVDHFPESVASPHHRGGVGRLRASIRQARLDGASASYRTPPAAWRKAVATLARRRSKELLALAADVERE